MSRPQLDRVLIASRLLTADFMQNVKMGGGLMQSTAAGGRCGFQAFASLGRHSADTGRSKGKLGGKELLVSEYVCECARSHVCLYYRALGGF